MYRWERRLDSHGRVYYVDHNTRSTTWQPPTQTLLHTMQNYQELAASRNSQIEQEMASRYRNSAWNTNIAGTDLLDPNSIISSSNPLGPLPPNWGEKFFCFCCC